jgi:DNA (cytosine-5)-methyltransferase 1
VAEIKRLFSFPDEFELVGTRASKQAQLGNSVPPLLAKQVFEHVKRALSESAVQRHNIAAVTRLRRG